MAIDQLKGAAGVEFLTTDLSAYSTNDDTSFKVGLVGWAPQGPSNQVVSINSVNQLYSLFGTPGKTAKNNQLLYAGALLLNTGAVLKVVRQVETTESLSAASIIFATNDSSILNYDSLLSGGFSAGYSGGSSYYGSYTGYTAISNNIFDVVNNLLPNISVTPDTTNANSAFTLATTYPGFNNYYVSVQTYSYYATTNESPSNPGVRDANVDTLTSKQISDDVEFTSYILGEGYYDVSQDRFFPNDAYTYTDDNDVVHAVTGVFRRYNSSTGTWVINDNLTQLIQTFGIIRVYSSATATTPIQVIPFTRNNYVTTTGIQLKLDVVTASGSLVVGIINNNFTGTWLGRTSYTITRQASTYSAITQYQTIPTLVQLQNTGSNPTSPSASPTYSYGWGLFKDVSSVSVNLLCAAGTTVNSFGTLPELTETINTDTIVSMLNVCTIRKDCIAIFDLPKRRDINALITATHQYVPGVGMESGGSNATFESFWGAMYDGRQVMFDTFNKNDVEVAMTSFVAQNITNVWSNTYPWYIVAGTTRGTIGYPSNGNVYIRYYPDEVGALTLERINTTRNLNGQVLWGEATLQLKNTSLNRLHAVSLLAYLYGTLRTKLTPYVFELNTPNLRKTIWNECNDVLSFIENNNGLYDYVVTCDDTNNTPSTIDQGLLYVDIAIEITKGAEEIVVRNTVYATGGITQAGLH